MPRLASVVFLLALSGLTSPSAAQDDAGYLLGEGSTGRDLLKLAKEAGDAVKTLTIAESRVSDSDLQKLEKLPSLTRLVIRDCERIEGKGFKYLKRIVGLETLRLEGGRLKKRALAQLAKIPSLRSLSIESTDLRADGLRGLEGVELEHLALITPGLNAEAFAKSLPKLAVKRLELIGMGAVTEASAFPRGLESLTLKSCRNLAGRTLCLSLANLTHLELFRSGTLDRDANLPALKSARLSGNAQDALASLADFPGLERLTLRAEARDAKLRFSGVPLLPSLRELQVSGFLFVSTKGLAAITPKLERLGFVNCGIDGLQQDSLAACKGLRKLGFVRCKQFPASAVETLRKRMPKCRIAKSG